MPPSGRWRLLSGDASVVEVLDRIKEATKALKSAKRRGVDVRPARPRLEESLRALSAGDYERARSIADELIGRYAESRAPADGL